MLSLSHTSGYAIQALGCLRERSGGYVMAKHIAACTGIPLPYLSKILHALGRSGLILTKRGYRGGFALARPADKVSVLDVAEAVEGGPCVPECLLGLGDCADFQACPTHAFWEVERLRIQAKLRRTTLRDVAEAVTAQARNRLRTCCSPKAAAGASRGKNGRKSSGSR